MADQIMASDKVHLKNQLGTLSKNDMLAVEDAILVHWECLGKRAASRFQL